MRSVFVCFLTAWCLAASGQAPRVTKVEPPSWWLGSTANPVRLLIRGENLQGATLSATGFKASNFRVNAHGTYLFADLDLAKAKRPGPLTLTVRTPAGAAEAGFKVLPRLDRKGRFQGFGPSDVLYLIMPDRFANGDTANDNPAVSQGLLDRAKTRYYHGGDLRGIIQRLPYLKDLGITALWLNPWYDNHNGLNQRETYDGQAITDYHGYGAVDFYAVEEHFGDLATLRELADKAHALGIKLIQDQVANHTGPYHPWVQDPPLPDWFHGTQEQHPNEDWQTWTLMDPAATPQARRLTLEGWFVDILPDLNHENPEVRRYVIQNALWWVGVAGLDGIRQDTLPYAPRWFWADWRQALQREFPQLSVVGEVLDGNPALVSFFEGGVKRFDGTDSRIESLFDFPLHFALRRTFARGESVREVAKVLAHDWLYRDPHRLVTLVGLHDVNRFMSEPGATLQGLKMAYSALFLLRGMPLVYYGDEIAMRGGNDPDNRRDFPGGWPGDARDAFTSAGRTAEENEVWSHVRLLAKVRAGSRALQTGRTELLHHGEQTLVYARRAAQEIVIGAFNNAAQSATLAFELDLPDGTALEPLVGEGKATVSGGKVELNVPARTSWLLAAKR
jgi:glycosidase